MALRSTLRRYPLLRGMATYVVLYPSSNAVQQLMQDEEPFNLRESLRFAVLGAFWVAPTLYTWIRIAGVWFPATTLRASVTKALLEQVFYSPFAISTFFIGMNLLQGNFDARSIKQEWKTKFLTTYSAGLMYWPIVQTINFSLVKERNRVPVVSAASFLWVTFLSYMKRKAIEEENEPPDATGWM